MLVRLFGRNFRSLKNDFELSMVAADLTREEDAHRGVIEVPITGMKEPLRLLRCVAIYGANASGKSTVLTVTRALRWLVNESSREAKPDQEIPPYEPFLLDNESDKLPITIGCDVVYKKSILHFSIEYNSKQILRETLSLLDETSETSLIEREPSGEVRGRLFPKAGANRLYVKEMQPNVSIVSKLAQHGPQKGSESIRPYFQALRNSMRYADYSSAAEMRIHLGVGKDERFAEDPEYQKWIMKHLIRAADVGISDVITEREPHVLPPELVEIISKSHPKLKMPETQVVVKFVHAGQKNVPIDFSLESSGTKKLFNISGDWWKLANESTALFADELSASLHPTLLDQLVRAVNEPPPARNVHSQVIFTTHDTGLLESRDGLPPALRRDQVYFAKKDVHGATEIFSLAEFKEDARPVHNIRKRYLSGLYGAIPLMEKLSL